MPIDIGKGGNSSRVSMSEVTVMVQR